MEIINDFRTSVIKAFDEIDENWRSYNGLVVAGTHNFEKINIEETINKIRTARKTGLPTLLICAGYQLGAIQWARDNGIPDATSEEFGKGTFVVRKRLEPKIGYFDGESWWSNYEVVIDWDIPDTFIAVPFHPEYGSSVFKPHPLLLKFLNLCKNNGIINGQKH